MGNGLKRCYLCGAAGIKEDFTKLFSDDGHYHWVCKSCAEEQEAEDQAERELVLVPILQMQGEPAPTFRPAAGMSSRTMIEPRACSHPASSRRTKRRGNVSGSARQTRPEPHRQFS